MAIINKTGITDGGTIQLEHVTRAIDALSGVSTDTIIATGSFTGSFKGDGSQLNGVSAGFPYTGSARITGSLIVTGSVTVTTGSVTLRNGLITSGSNLFDGPVTVTDDVMITGSLTYYYASGSIDGLLDKASTFFAYGEIISGDTSQATASSCSAMYLNAGGDWKVIEQSSYDVNKFPLMGVALNSNASNGMILLSGYITGFRVGGTPIGGIPIQDDAAIEIGNSVFVQDSSLGLYSTVNPEDVVGGPVLQIGHVIHRDIIRPDKYVIKVNPRWLYTV
jgi:hypothetical protein